jgi:hypothetical protein
LTWIDRLFKKSKISNVHEEVKLYLSEPMISKESNPLLYWQENKKKFPCLYVMAMKHLSACATSTSSEIGFSGGRLICNYTRRFLSPVSEVLATVRIQCVTIFLYLLVFGITQLKETKPYFLALL